MRIMAIDLCDMAHFFVLQNVELMSLWRRYYFCVTLFHYAILMFTGQYIMLE
jgi:hypothetical protein